MDVQPTAPHGEEPVAVEEQAAPQAPAAVEQPAQVEAPAFEPAPAPAPEAPRYERERERGNGTGTSNGISMKALLEAGVHFGHLTKRWNPKMKPYIFTERNGIHIIDLQQTVSGLKAAMEYVSTLVANGGRILFIGTKKQAQEAIMEEAERAGQFYVNRRWMGGMLTNFKTIRTRLAYLAELEARRARGEFSDLPKAEAMKLEDQINRLNNLLGGIKDMNGLPDALFVIDVGYHKGAVIEAKKLGIPIIGIIDTNNSPDGIDYVIPGNDDSTRAIRLYARGIADAILEGRNQVITELVSEEFVELEEPEKQAG